MLLADWRKEQGWTLARLGEELGVSGKSPAETVRRWETGESRPDADIVARIEEVSEGKVTAADMHEVRLAWLKSRSDAPLEAAE